MGDFTGVSWWQVRAEVERQLKGKARQTGGFDRIGNELANMTQACGDRYNTA